MKFRWKGWAVGAAALLAGYTLVGFWLVPLAIKDQLPKLIQSELEHQASVDKVSFNPYTLRLKADGLRLAQANGEPLFTIGNLSVQMQWKSLYRRAWSFADIRITDPSANLVMTTEGRFNLGELLDALERRARKRSDVAATLPRLVVERFTLERGKLDLHDRRAGYTNHFSPIDFVLINFSTLPEQTDTHVFTAESVRGGKLRWKGNSSLNPIRASGEIILETVSLPDLAVYLKSYTGARAVAGDVSATLPYALSYENGKFEANLAGAKMSFRNLALAREDSSDSFAALKRLEVGDINADLARREATVGEIRADGGKLSVKRDAKGEIDLANLKAPRNHAAGPQPNGAAPQPDAAVVANGDWKLVVNQVTVDDVALSAQDEMVNPPLKLESGKASLRLQLAAGQTGSDLRLAVQNAELSLADLILSSGDQTPVKLAQLGFAGGSLDLGARRASLDRLYAQGGQLQLARDQKGQVTLLRLLPKLEAPESRTAPSEAAAGKPWTAMVKSLDVSQFSADLADEGTGIKVHVSDLAMKIDGASNDLARPVQFNANLNLREGGQLSAQGSAVPGSGVLQADVNVKQLALKPLQPLLSQHLKLKIAGGSVSAQGRLTNGEGTPARASKPAGLRYVGSLNVAGLTLNEDDGELFASWKNMAADKFTASLSPNRLDIAQLRVVEPNAKLIIEDDRSFNAARLLVRKADSARSGPAAVKPVVAPTVVNPSPAAQEQFLVRVQRVRVQNGKLDFNDLSLRPQFGAKIYELNGVVNGLSSRRGSRTQIELDGRVDEFGLARIRGELHPFDFRNNTDLNLVFRNVDMASVSPYTMKFAGYSVSEGKMSLDLQYKVRDSQLEGANQIVIDKLTLGERVDSPDAFKLPLQLAISILKDSNGRIDLGLPVSGNLNDPDFSYGALIWKAIGSLLTKIVTAPFRALMGGGGEKLEAIDFDPGSDKLLPPEREKIKQVAQLLAEREELKLTVPAQYSEAGDGAALKARAVRVEVAARAGIKVQPGEEPGPVDLSNRAVRSSLRDLYAERFGDKELDNQKKAAEGVSVAGTGTPATAPAGTATTPAPKVEAGQLPLWQRVGNAIQGEPQVADRSTFYNQLREQLEQNQAIPPDALPKLGAQRGSAIIAALTEAGVDPARTVAAAPEKIASDPGKPVPLKLALATK